MEMNRSAKSKDDGSYKRLAIMIGLSFISMYAFMYAMVNSFSNVYISYNQLYMAGVMTAPMVVIELLVMSSMYKDRKRNVLILLSSVAVGVVCFAFIRYQTAISDHQFLRSMIPHHAGAILMCEESPAQSSVIKGLCADIIKSQQAEIKQMKDLLEVIH